MNIGVIGSGMISEIYLQNMTQKFSGLHVVAVASRNPENAKKRAEQFGIEACTVEELLGNPDIEMIVILTPVGAHYGLIRQALLAGKHVYTEKTITGNLAQAEELLKLAEEKGLYLGAAPDTFLGSALQAARAAIDDGMLGEIHSFTISANRDNSILLSIFSFLREPGAGVLFDYGVYYVTALVSLLGPVARVGSVVGTPYKTHLNIFPNSPEFGQMMDTPNESQVSAVLKLKNGITGTLHIDNDSNLKDEAFFAIYGTKGILYLSDPNEFGGEVRFQPNSTDFAHPAPPVSLWKFTPYEKNSRGVGPAEMADAIAGHRANRASKEMAYHVLEVLEAALKGGEDGAFVDIVSDCRLPEPLPQKAVPITNIGHITFQMKNEAEMVRFYGETLGMKPLFVLTVSDLAETMKNTSGEQAAESIKDLVSAAPQAPWIQYFKLSDHQYLELFYGCGMTYGDLEGKREDYYGFRKVNYEVDDVEKLYSHLREAGVEIKEGVHFTADGSKEFAVSDPDGNEIQFTQYGADTVIPVREDAREVCSMVKCTTQVALQVEDEINMKNFYCRGLGLKKAFTLTFGDLAGYLEKSGIADGQMLDGLKMMADKPWIDYIEIAPRQYIEFFYCTGQVKKQERDLQKYYGYQHICLEVSDIHAAWDAVTANGICPTTQIALGVEGAYQFWMEDPDGNKIEFMEYATGAKQLL